MYLHADDEDSDQTARTRRLIRVFVGRTCLKVRFLPLRLFCVINQVLILSSFIEGLLFSPAGLIKYRKHMFNRKGCLLRKVTEEKYNRAHNVTKCHVALIFGQTCLG